MEMQLPEDFKELLKLLNLVEVEYLLTGGFAVGYDGYSRATSDMEVWVSGTKSNAAKLVATLEEFGFRTPELRPELFQKPDCIVRTGVPPMRVEILTSISAVEFEQCYRARLRRELDGVDVDLIALENLKKNKLASGRYKDLHDLEHLP